MVLFISGAAASRTGSILYREEAAAVAPGQRERTKLDAGGPGRIKHK